MPTIRDLEALLETIHGHGLCTRADLLATAGALALGTPAEKAASALLFKAIKIQDMMELENKILGPSGPSGE